MNALELIHLQVRNSMTELFSFNLKNYNNKIVFSEFFEKAKRQRFFDDLSDDDEYQNMTEEERNEKMAPKSMTSKLNLDGAVSLDDESSDEEQIVKVS